MHEREPLRAGSNQALRRRQAPGEGEAPQLVEDVVKDAATLAAGAIAAFAAARRR
jgi:hypothetical protein